MYLICKHGKAFSSPTVIFENEVDAINFHKENNGFDIAKTSIDIKEFLKDSILRENTEELLP